MIYTFLPLTVLAFSGTAVYFIFKDAHGKNPYSGRTWGEIYLERSQREDSRYQSQRDHVRWRYHNDIGYKECNECSKTVKL